LDFGLWALGFELGERERGRAFSRVKRNEFQFDLSSVKAIMKELPWAYMTIEDLSENDSQESLFPEQNGRSNSSSFRKAESEV